jgi:X-X-X-Leu-X-X-Gly heptad repeat protein
LQEASDAIKQAVSKVN